MKIHVKIQNKTYEVRIADIHARPIQASVDGESFDVWPEEMTLPAQDYQPPMSSSAEKQIKQVSIEEPDCITGRQDQTSQSSHPRNHHFHLG